MSTTVAPISVDQKRTGPGWHEATLRLGGRLISRRRSRRVGPGGRDLPLPVHRIGISSAYISASCQRPWIAGMHPGGAQRRGWAAWRYAALIVESARELGV